MGETTQESTAPGSSRWRGIVAGDQLLMEAPDPTYSWVADWIREMGAEVDCNGNEKARVAKT